MDKKHNLAIVAALNKGWIPVSVALPEDDKIVAVTAVTKKGVRSWNRAFYDGATWHGSGSMAGAVAWMEIEPWEGDVTNG